MRLLLNCVLFYILFSSVLAYFKQQSLEPWLQEYLAVKKTCQDTFFPEPPCCGVSIKQMISRIVGGKSTGLNELPWVVHINTLLEIKDELYIGTCAGSLINSLWVLSAAHCFQIKQRFPQRIEVRIGEWNIDANPDCNGRNCAPDVNKIPVKAIILHPKQDLALLRLNRGVEYSIFVSPICLPLTPLKKSYYENKPVVVAGWGRTIAETKRGSSIKLKTTLTVLTEERCSLITESSDYICAKSYDSGSACKGDSGGPLNLKLPNDVYYQLGVVSVGSENCESFWFPNLFARIDNKWIRRSINEYENEK